MRERDLCRSSGVLKLAPVIGDKQKSGSSFPSIGDHLPDSDGEG